MLRARPCGFGDFAARGQIGDGTYKWRAFPGRRYFAPQIAKIACPVLCRVLITTQDTRGTLTTSDSFELPFDLVNLTQWWRDLSIRRPRTRVQEGLLATR